MSDQIPNPSFTQAAFEALFKTHFAYLCNFANQYVNDREVAQDICQQSFIKLWEKRADMDPAQSVQSYLFTSVKNRCLNYLRDNQKYRSRILDLDCGDIDFSQEVEDLTATEELQQRIDAALASLPEKCRQVFERSRFQQMKYQDIANELDISLKTVEAHMSKALKTLRAALSDYEFLWLLLLLGQDLFEKFSQLN